MGCAGAGDLQNARILSFQYPSLIPSLSGAPGLKAMRFQDGGGRATAFARGVGLAAISLVLLLVWLAADPQAHEHFHHDAGHEDHRCVITDFALGEGFYLLPAMEVRPVVVAVEWVAFEAVDSPREAVDYALLPSCGPPSGAASA